MAERANSQRQAAAGRIRSAATGAQRAARDAQYQDEREWGRQESREQRGNQISQEPIRSAQPESAQPEQAQQPQPQQQPREQEQQQPERQQQQAQQAASLNPQALTAEDVAAALSPASAPAQQQEQGTAQVSGYEEAEADAVPETGQMSAMSYTEPLHSAEEISAMRAEEAEAEPEPEEPVDNEHPVGEAVRTLASQQERREVTPPNDGDNGPGWRERVAPALQDIPSIRSGRAEKKERAMASEVVKKRMFRGAAVYDKISSSSIYGLREVGVGTQNIVECLAQPKNGLLKLIADETGIVIDPNSETLVQDVVEAVNGAEIMVATTKSPVNRGSSYQARVLRIFDGRGIQLHPIMAKEFNGDFDGDPMNVSFDRKAVRKAKDAMSYIIDVDGLPMIDLDFFPLAKLTGPYADKTDAIGYVNDIIFKRRNKEDKRVLSSALVDLCEEPTDENLKRFAVAVSEVCEKYKSKKYEVMDDTLKATYDGMRHLKLWQAQLRPEVETSVIDDLPPAKNSSDRALYKVVDDLVEGTCPMNMQELKTRMCSYLGEVDGKNITFRFTANVAKMFRFDKRVAIGDVDGEEFADILEKTMQFAMSMRISRAASVGTKAKVASEMIKELVIGQVGFPDDPRYRTMQDFLNRFASVYHYHERIINMADVAVFNDMSVQQKDAKLVRTLDGDTFAHIVTPFVNIYGEYSVGRMFGRFFSFGKDSRKNRKIWGGENLDVQYRDWSIRQLARQNKLIKSTKSIKDVKKKKYGDPNVNAAESLLLAIADQKTSASVYFNKKVYRGKDCMVEKMYGCIKALRKQVERMEKGSRDWLVWSNEIIELLNVSGPDMFHHFGMDSANFFMSDYGSAMMEAENTDVMGGIRMAIVFDYRMARVFRQRQKLHDVIKSGAKPSKVALAENAVRAEEDQLSSTSFVWHAIINERRAIPTQKAWTDLSKLDDRSRVGTLNAPEYWKDPKHDNITDMMLDAKMPKTLKDSVLSDVVRWWENFDGISSSEMAYQLEMDNAPMWDSLSPTSTSIFDVVTDFDGRYNSYKKRSYKAMLKNVSEAKKHHRDEIVEAVEMLAKNPEQLVMVDDGMFADAVLTVVDKVYKQSEKSGQHPDGNAIYNAMSYQRSGGVFNDVRRTDDRAIGAVCSEDLSVIDIVKLLGDPDFELYVYDKYTGKGRPVNRETLLGSRHPTDAEMWDFLEENPRICAAIRVHASHAKVYEAKGGATLGAALSTSETINNVLHIPAKDLCRDKAKAMLRDHPTFGAMIALLNPTKGKVSRNMRSRYMRTEADLVETLLALASRRKRGIIDEMDSVMDVVFGITRESLADTGLWDGDKEGFFEKDEELTSDVDTLWGLLKGNPEGETAEEVQGKLNKYVDDLVEMMDENGFDMEFDLYGGLFDGVDLESCAAFFDVRQELNGVKTATSTGVEGTETWKHALWMSLLESKDKYADEFTMKGITEENADDLLNGCVTNFGTIGTDGSFAEILEKAGEEELVIEIPEDVEVLDKTTDNRGRQVSSVNAYFIIKRDNGAENFNLKIKKKGDDGTDSITKYDKYSGTSYRELLGKLRDVYAAANDNMFYAKLELARVLKKANEDIGYDDMTLANYMCIADVMLLEGTREDGSKTVYLRSLEMLSTAIKYTMPRGNLNVDDLRIHAQTVRDTLGLETDEGPNVVHMLEQVRVAGAWSSRPGIRQYSSPQMKGKEGSPRNYNLLAEICKQTGRRIMGEKTVKEFQGNLLRDPGLKAIYKGIKSVRNFNLLGDIGHTVHENPGYATLWVLRDPSVSREEARAALRRAYQLGISVMVTDECTGLVPRDLLEDLAPFPGSEQHGMLPFFDMRLNGSEAFPTEPRFAVFQADQSRAVAGYEDVLGEYDQGDATIQPFDALTDRVRFEWADRQPVSVEGLFPNVFGKYNLSDYPDAVLSVSFVSEPTVHSLIVNQYEDVTIDYGVAKSADALGASRFSERKERIDRLIEKFRENYRNGNVDENGFVREADAGDIVAWAMCAINDGKGSPVEYCLAPIIPFELMHGDAVPTHYKVKNVEMQVGDLGDVTQFNVDWEYSDDIRKHYFKMHEGAGAANKGVGSFADSVPGLTLKNGHPLDCCYAAESTSSRRGGTERRIRTMESMMFVARMDGYNFADVDKAFPDNASIKVPDSFEGDLKSELSRRRISREEWEQVLAENPDFRWHSDPKVNAFVAMEVEKFMDNGGTPSDYLASEFDGQRTDVFWEFAAMFNQSFTYQDGLMRFLHAVYPKLCANGLRGPETDTLFRVCDGAGFDKGCLQMQVPHRSAKNPNEVFWLWENVYFGWSFFGEDFSGFHRPSVNGSSNSLEAINTMSLMNMAPSNFDFQAQLRSATSDMADIAMAPGILEAERDIIPGNDSDQDGE